MSLLIGFPNQVFTPNLRLGLYHESGDKLQWIIPDLPWKTSGATGIASNGKWIYVSYQKAGLAVYDFGFQIRQFYEYKFVNDPHSLKFYKDNILVVSSGTNEIYKLFLDDKGFADHEELFWRPADLNKTQKDLIHVNSLSVSKNGEVFITLFGNKNPKGWEKTLCGELVNISSNQVILRGLQNPHTA
ncbi:MAG: hypothetical protein GTN53_41105, partial [Candidatus Aminicenantes bacterium]|nr:hypothetical protein [Candidatus Aminicenantes bacterium]